MMIDNNLVLSSAQAVTATAVSTNVIDQLAAGAAVEGSPWFQFLVNTLFAAAGAATLTIAVQDSADNVTFADIMVSAAIPVASLIAGYVAFNGKLPPIVRRYIRANYTVATGPMTAGKIDGRFVLGIDKTIDRIL